jgi:hypothetical protein
MFGVNLSAINHTGVSLERTCGQSGGDLLIAVVTRHVQVNENGVILAVLQPRLEFCLAVFKLAHLLPDVAPK